MESSDINFAEILTEADTLIRLMRDHEVELASTIEPLLFPDGAPENFTIAEMMRAQAKLLARSAQAMAEADIAYNAALQKYRRPSPQQTSLISQEVAHKLALSAELENLVISMAEKLEAEVVTKLFPDGLPPELSMLGFLQSLRGYLESERDRVTQVPRDEDEHSEGELRKAVTTIATIYSGFCDQASMDLLADEVRAYAAPHSESLHR